MKRLWVDWGALGTAFESPASDFAEGSYLDLVSGKIVYSNEDTRSACNLIVAELEEAYGEDADWTDELIRQTESFQDLSEWEQQSVLAAMRREYGDPDQFARVPVFDSSESYQWMRDFIDTLEDDQLRSRLSKAVSQESPFRRFRAALTDDRRLEQQWRAFEDACQRATITKWLRSIGFEPANPDDSAYSPPPLPDLRNIMFAEVRRFVRFARDIGGVRRIALIGGLTTDKEFPRGIEILATVTADCDLGPLARLGRELNGHMLSHQAGSDVFLASKDAEYLGRTCEWRNCAPGIRVSCDALNCGRRHYLHDDFNAIRLDRDIISDPPVVLWPKLAAAPGVAADIDEQLLKPLAEDATR